MEEIVANQIPLRNKAGEIVGHAICSEEDFEDFSNRKWHISKGYAGTSIDGRNMPMHKYVMLKMDAYIKGMTIDHVNNDKFDNRRENLRLLTQHENNQNRPHISKYNYRGVKERKYGMYSARTHLNGKEFHIGVFPNEHAAALAYDIFLAHQPSLSLRNMNWPEKREEFARLPLVSHKVDRQAVKYIGVGKRQNKYRARVMINRVEKVICVKDSELEAAKAYDEYIVKNNINRKINFPENYPDYNITKTAKIDVSHDVVRLVLETNPEAKVLIDVEDYDKLKHYKFHLNDNGYVITGTSRLHRLLMGVSDPKIFIDHIDGDPLNNCKNNLRISDSQKNAQNNKKRKNTTSQYIGVSKKNNSWTCAISWTCQSSNERKKFQKVSQNEEEAARLRDIFIMENLPDTHYKMNFSWTEEEKIQWKNKLGM
jgi:hypothetical protein